PRGMEDVRIAPVQRVRAATRTGWTQTVAFLEPRCQRLLAVARARSAQAIAFLAPRCRRLLVAARAGCAHAVRIVAFHARRWAAQATGVRSRVLLRLGGCSRPGFVIRA